MKFGWGAVLLILIQCIVFSYSNTILHELRKRQIQCPEGEYFAEAHCCKFCRPGTYAKDDCTEDHGKPNCQSCDGEHYMDADNGYKMCHKCSHCDDQLGKKEVHACTVRKNTVCGCKEKYFCAKNGSEPDSCADCEYCNPCTYGDAEPCTTYKDTVCKSRGRHHYWTIVSVVLIPMIFLGILLYVRVRCNNKKTKNSGQREEQPFIFPDKLKDIDLDPYLTDFSQNMDVNTVLLVVRKMGLGHVRIDSITNDYVRNHDDQKFYLLNAWYESHGKTGAFQNLIRTLENNKMRVTAEKLINITSVKVKSRLMVSDASNIPL